MSELKCEDIVKKEEAANRKQKIELFIRDFKENFKEELRGLFESVAKDKKE